jgi:hypothetical protein
MELASNTTATIPPPVQLNLEPQLKELLDRLVKHSGQFNLYHYNRKKISVSLDGLTLIFGSQKVATYVLHFTKFVYQLREGCPQRRVQNSLNRLTKLERFIQTQTELKSAIRSILEEIIEQLQKLIRPAVTGSVNVQIEKVSKTEQVNSNEEAFDYPY